MSRNTSCMGGDAPNNEPIAHRGADCSAKTWLTLSITDLLLSLLLSRSCNRYSEHWLICSLCRLWWPGMGADPRLRNRVIFCRCLSDTALRCTRSTAPAARELRFEQLAAVLAGPGCARGRRGSAG